MNTMRIALCQPKVLMSREAAVEKAAEMVREAAGCGAQLVVLPEMFHCPYAPEYFPVYAETAEGEMFRIMSSWARDNGVYLVGGSIPEREKDKIYNTCFCFDPQGKLVARHRKIHLFDVDIPGQITFQESDYFSPGDTETLFDTPFGKVGVAICFDQRFPGLIRSLAKQGAMLVCTPAQFNNVTGPRHWDTLVKARALDNQIYYAACSAATDPDFSYKAYGHSCVVDPNGQILVDAGTEENIIYCEIDQNVIDSTRKEMPTFLHS
ncbi:MAG: carbon-nitrogen hydrolase family protein [Candidatus Limivicinus sp.]